jgi:hypothetical protein
MVYAGGKIEPRKVDINIFSWPRKNLKSNRKQKIKKEQKNKLNNKKKW